MIRYIGNKTILSDFIVNYLPKDIKTYCEPFGGTMGLFFSLDLNLYKDTKFIYNDINSLNSNLFELLNKDKFIELINSTNIDKDIFIESYSKLKSKSKYEKALAWLIILCNGELKDLMSQKYTPSIEFQVFKYKLKHYGNYISRLEVKNIDYKKIFELYDSEDTFFYIDPPYKGYEDYYINHDFRNEKHLELFNSIKNLKSKWILSYYKFPEMIEWYKGYKMVSKKSGLGEEYLIMNYNI